MSSSNAKINLENTKITPKNLVIKQKYTEKRGRTTFKYIFVTFLKFGDTKYCIFYDYVDSKYMEIEIDEYIDLEKFKIDNSDNSNIDKDIFKKTSIFLGLEEEGIFPGLTEQSQLLFFKTFDEINSFHNEEPNEPKRQITNEEKNMINKYRKNIIKNQKKDPILHNNKKTSISFGNNKTILIPSRKNNNYIQGSIHESGQGYDNNLTLNQLKTLHIQKIKKCPIGTKVKWYSPYNKETKYGKITKSKKNGESLFLSKNGKLKFYIKKTTPNGKLIKTKPNYGIYINKVNKVN